MPYTPTIELIADQANYNYDWSAEDFAAALAKPCALPFTPGDKNPYTFAATTVGEMLRYIVETRHGEQRYDYHDRTPFAWNVKAHHVVLNTDMESPRDPSLDDAWEAYLESPRGQWVHEEVFEGAQSEYRDEWTSYPGDDQGDWKFAFYGRSGGWLCLTAWRGYNFNRMDETELADFLAMLVYEHETTQHNALARLYAGFVCADQDFTPKKASENISYHYSYQRALWEETRGDANTRIVAAMVEAGEQAAEDYGVDFEPEALKKLF